MCAGLVGSMWMFNGVLLECGRSSGGICEEGGAKLTISKHRRHTQGHTHTGINTMDFALHQCLSIHSFTDALNQCDGMLM